MGQLGGLPMDDRACERMQVTLWPCCPVLAAQVSRSQPGLMPPQSQRGQSKDTPDKHPRRFGLARKVEQGGLVGGGRIPEIRGREPLAATYPLMANVERKQQPR